MLEFKDYLFIKFQEWERTQPTRRSSFSAYSRWLSDNKLKLRVPQPVLDAWLNGRYKPGIKYVTVLEEKLGPEVYQYLDLDPHLTYITAHWGQLPPGLQQDIQKQIQKYLASQGENNEANTYPKLVDP